MIKGFFSDKDLWTEMLKESDYDFYHLPEYLEVEKSLVSGEATYYYFHNNGSKALIPLIKKTIDGTEYCDVASPYGYAGILTNRDFNHKHFDEVISAFVDDCFGQKIVSAFLRLNSFLNRYLFIESDIVQQFMHGKTVLADLSETYDNLKKQFSNNHKRNIKKLEKAHFTVVFNDYEKYIEWQELYISTMKRLDASNYYLFNQPYFQQLRKILGEHLNLVTVHDKEGKIAAGGLFTTYNGIIQYHLGGTADEYLALAPTKLMFDRVIKWGTENNMKILHLGGGLGGRADSLFKFKHGFSQKTLSFSTLRCITNKEVYNNLVNRHRESKHEEEMTDFFPLYRMK